MKAISTTLALSAGNFIFQQFQTDPNWHAAWERSFFQAIAIAVYVFISKESK